MTPKKLNIGFELILLILLVLVFFRLLGLQENIDKLTVVVSSSEKLFKSFSSINKPSKEAAVSLDSFKFKKESYCSLLFENFIDAKFLENDFVQIRMKKNGSKDFISSQKASYWVEGSKFLLSVKDGEGNREVKVLKDFLLDDNGVVKSFKIEGFVVSNKNCQ
jgi:hypothetical protein